MTRLRLLRAVAGIGVALLACVLPGTTPAAAAAVGAPTLNSVRVASDGKVTVSWTDSSTTEDRFDIQRRDSTGQHAGQWWALDGSATRNKAGTGDSYTWTDGSPFILSDGERCYRVVASGNVDFEEVSAERCVTAPVAATSAPVQPVPGTGKSHVATPGASPKPGIGTNVSGAPGVTGSAVGTAGIPVVPGVGEPGAAGSSTPDQKLAAGGSSDRPGDSRTIWYLVGAVGSSVLAFSAALVGLSMERSRRRRVAARVAGLDGTLSVMPGMTPSAVPAMAPPPEGAPAVATYEMWAPPPTNPGLPPINQWSHDGGLSRPRAPWEPRSGG